MKIYSEIYAFVFIICVFGADGDGVKRESVKEGDSVTLDTRLREPFFRIWWWFGDSGSIIAESDGYKTSYTDDERFRDRLKLNDQTGSLTINNTRITDSGLYELEIEQNDVTSYETFIVTVHVFGADEDGVKRVSVMEGDSVTLDTGLREKFNHIMWRFGGSIIAETDSNEISYHTERFRDRLKLNNQTGSLTINNMRITDSGLYELVIDHSAGTATVRFSVTVYVFGADEDGVKRESVMEGDSVTLDTGLREKFNRIQWRFGDSVSIIAETDGNKISYTDDERFRDRLKLNHQTGSLTINNMRITDSGLYKLVIIHSAGTSTVRFNVTVYGSFYPDPGLSPGDVTGIVVVLLLMLSAAAAVPAILYCRHKISKRKRQNQEEKTESAKEGESVALKTDTEKQTDEEKLKLDHQSGSLKTTDSGDYKPQIKPCSEDGVNTIFVEEGNHVTLNPDTEVQRDDLILWMFGDQGYLIVQMSGRSRETFDGPDGRFRDRLKLDEKTGSLTITNIKSEHTGCYKLQIASSRGTKYKIFKVITHGFTGKNANELETSDSTVE